MLTLKLSPNRTLTYTVMLMVASDFITKFNTFASVFVTNDYVTNVILNAEKTE